MAKKIRLAVIFGGSSPEHDVSVVSAHQLMDAVDVSRYEVVPFYLNFENALLTGPNLRDISKFRPRPGGLKEAEFFWSDAGPAYKIKGLRGAHPIDCVLPVFHGAFGEDGRIQAHFEVLGIPVTGFSAINSAAAMRKDFTKAIVKGFGVNVVDHVLVRKGASDLKAHIKAVQASFGFPVIVKPASLGSSIGVGLAKTPDELGPLISMVLQKDEVALIEPQVQNLVEYNVALTNRDGEIALSAIERPKTSEELLDFKEKYLSASGGGAKGEFKPSEGMLSLTRDINPKLKPAIAKKISHYAKDAFEALGARGAPRIDFMCDAKTGEIWFNEINPIPGSYGFFLWEASTNHHMLFSELVDHLVSEAMGDTVKRFDDPVPQDAYLLPR
jgi:D-alanine-D-alanine ligase